MLVHDDWLAYCERHSLSPGARDYLEEARTGGPSRKVGERAKGNIAVWHSSAKMGETVPAESWTAESAYYRECEYDATVAEYWTQPPPVRVTRIDKHGRKRRGSYTPDALVVPFEQPPYVVEVKPLATVQELLGNRHPDWCRSGDSLIYKPAKTAFAAWGLEHRVVAISTAQRVRHVNLAVLLRARDSLPEYDRSLKERLATFLGERAWASLHDVATHLDLPDLTAIIQLVAEGELHADIDNELLAEPRASVVTRSQDALHYWMELRDRSDVQRDAASGPAPGIERIPSLPDVQQALKNLRRLESGESSRHVRRLRAKVREGRANGLSPYQALLGGTHRSGNYGPRLARPVQDTLAAFLEEEWGKPRRLSVRKAYRAYCVKARTDHPNHEPAGRTTFRKAISALDRETVAHGRGGRRSAGAEAAPSPVAERAIRAILPFQIATADHYKVDVYVVLYSQGETMYTVRLWLTILKDLFSGQVLGRFLSAADPSRVSCAMVLRDCVRRNERLPAMIMVDRGKEFDSVYFRGLLADLGVDLAFRPAEQPRYGSEAERLFGEFRTEWLSYLDGNSVQWCEGRSVSVGKRPQNLAALKPADLLEHLNQFLEWREQRLQGAALHTPDQAAKELGSLYPFVGIKQELDHEFLVKSAVDVRTYSVDPRRGIHTGEDLHFWAPELRRVRSKQEVEVRMDPECPYQLYARIKGQWVTCEASRNVRYWRQRAIEREAEAVKRYGAGALRARARQDAQEDLVKLQTEVEDRQRGDCESVDEETTNAGASESVSLFDQVRDAPADNGGAI